MLIVESESFLFVCYLAMKVILLFIMLASVITKKL